MAGKLDITAAQRDHYIAWMEDKSAELSEKRRNVAYQLRELSGTIDRIDNHLSFIDWRIDDCERSNCNEREEPPPLNTT